jgi:carbonic anhydrase/acetyltransferase-like protein (isoleucine patch superfamily)
VIVEFEGYRPRVAASAFIAPTAVLIGNVVISENASVWYGAVLRADHAEQAIVIGQGSNVQDNCVIHVALDKGTIVGEQVTIGHGAILEACDIGDEAVIGMNAVVLERAKVGARSLVAAGSTVLARTEVPEGVLCAGSPAVVKGPLEGAARWWIEKSGTYYVDLATRYRAEGLADKGGAATEA